MEMVLVRVSADDESMIAFQKTLGKLIADTVRFLRCDLSRFEGLTYLIGNHIAILLSSGQLKILSLGKSEIRVGGILVAGMAGDESAILRLVRILAVIDAL